MVSCLALGTASASADTPARFENQTAEQWLAILRDHDDYRQRRRAAYALGQIGPAAADAVEELTKALDDRQLELGWYAADALGNIGPAAKSATPALVAALTNPANDNALRRAAAQALGKIGNATPDAIEALEQALAHDDVVYQAEAALALYHLAISEQGLESLTQLVGHDDEPAAIRAATALASLGKNAAPATDALVRALGADSTDVRRAAGAALAEIGLMAAKALHAAMKNQSVDLRVAADTLGMIAEHARIESLSSDPQPPHSFAEVRRRAPTDIAPPLVALFAHQDPAIRAAAARAVARMGTVGLASLLTALRSNNEKERTTAIDALARAENYLPQSTPSPSNPPTDAVLQLQRELLPQIIALMSDEHLARRRTAFRLFDALQISDGAGDAIPLLRSALGEQDVPIRRYAMRSLRRLESAATSAAVEPTPAAD